MKQGTIRILYSTPAQPNVFKMKEFKDSWELDSWLSTAKVHEWFVDNGTRI